MSDDYLVLTEFIPGTKAKAQEVNSNFNLLKEAIVKKASMNGDNTQKFSVSNAVENSHAVNKSQLEEAKEVLNVEIKKTDVKFCAKAGNTTNGKADLFSFNVYEVIPRIGGSYGTLTISDYRGIQTVISSSNTLNLTGTSNGTYNIFIKPNGVIYVLSNTIYKQAKRPTMVINDVWLNTSQTPFNCIKYNGSTDEEFLDVPLGKVVFENGAVKSISSFDFNQNGYEINSQSAILPKTNLALSVTDTVIPNYKSGVSKAWGALHTADINGMVFMSGWSNQSGVTFVLSDVTYSLFGGSGASYSGNAIFFVSVGDTYKTVGGSGTVTFFPLKGVN